MDMARYKKDMEKLKEDGNGLELLMLIEVYPEKRKTLKISKEKQKKIPRFSDRYQSWYSESLACISQLLPHRLQDFISYYKPLKTRKEISYANYTVSDYLQGLTITRGWQKDMVVGPDAAIPAFTQQLNIVKALAQRFESSLFDIRALVQADLFDNELDAAEELNKKGFRRGAGAIAGVVLEGHLRSICDQRKITARKNSALAALNDLLKQNYVLDTPTWRFIQHLTDLRNLCDHKMAKDPTTENIEELVEGVRKITKTVF